MNKHLLIICLLILTGVGVTVNMNAQSSTVVPNPNAPGIFSWVAGGALSGYAGTPIVFNNTLVLEYNATGTSDPAQIKLQLAVYNGGDTLHLIPNPDAGQGVYFQSIQIIFNNLLFFIYLDVAGVQRLASFNGSAITLYPNPDAATIGYVGSPRIYNNSLYVAYVNAAGITQFGKFTGSGISLIPNPDNSSTGFYNDYSVVFNNKICSRYVTAAGPKQLATFDGTQWTLWPNPDNTTRGFYPDFPIAYQNKLYMMYFSATGQYQYMQWDGTSNPALIANPQSSGTNGGGVAGLPILFNDTLFFQYYDIANVYRLAKFDGTSISLIPSPDATTYGYWNTPVIYNNNLYIFYLPVDGTHHLTQYVPTSNSLKVYANPDAGLGYWDQPIVYDGKLFFQYYNAQSVFQLGYFDGSSLKILPNPTGVYNGTAGNNGYMGNPIIWNSLLYTQFGGVPYGNAGNLAFFNGSVLPVTLTSFTAEKIGAASLLKWNTASEINSAYFSVERSPDGSSFQPIGKVLAHGTVALPEQYQFTDNAPVSGLNYYRLKQVDFNGNFTYSTIATVNFTGITGFKIFPNPVAGSMKIYLPTANEISMVRLYDITGKKVLETQISANTVSATVDVSSLSAGIYQCILAQGKQLQTIQIVKE